MTPEQEATLATIVAGMPRSAPPGWLRIVSRQECTVRDGSPNGSSVDVVIVQTPSGLVQETYREPDDMFFDIFDFQADLARSSETGSIVLNLTIDRDGSYTADVVEEDPKVLDGIRDETSSRPIHNYLANNRADLEALAARLT